MAGTGGSGHAKRLARAGPAAAAARGPAPPLPAAPARPTPEADAAHLGALLAEGATPMLLNGRLFLLGKVTPKAQALLNAHGPAIARLIGAFAAGKVDRQALAAKLADVDGWRWPGTADAAAKWPGALGLPARRRAHAVHRLPALGRALLHALWAPAVAGTPDALPVGAAAQGAGAR